MPKRLFVSSIAIVASAILSPRADAQQACESLINLKLSHTTILSATVVPEKPFNANRPGLPALPPVTLPAHCEVKGVARPTSDSEIKFEVWLPVSGWNGKFQQVGNGGWAGSIPTQSMVEPLRRGYATAGTDDGHSAGPGAIWAMGHPEKLIDFGYRAVHETSEQSKAIIRAFYGKAESFAYFVGCSDGGREALMEAQRYPDDFNGIIAGAPANFWTYLLTEAVWNAQALASPESFIPPSKLPAIQKAAVEACDTIDGVKDGVIEDPRRCHFNPDILTCKGADGPDCLTGPQVEALKRIYEGPKNPRSGEQVFPGFSPGTEAVPGNWALWITGTAPGRSLQFMFGNTFYQHVVFEDLKWDYRALNFDGDVKLADQKAKQVLNSDNPDLRPFRARGGKLIQYHGWGDAAIPPLSSILYYGQVRSSLMKNRDAGAKAREVGDFYRLFMVPGMGHCAGGLGANNFGNFGVSSAPPDPDHDIVSALERWVEKGVAPARIVASGYVDGNPSKGAITRPLCPYPTVAHWKGTGSTNDAGNFECVDEKPVRAR
jgi:feruloyl esterase